MTPFILFDYIGHYGPAILFTMTFYVLLHRNIYLSVFVIGSLLNLLLNVFLKKNIREPRPNNPLQFIDSDYLIGSNRYGLPSGHAQSCLFSLTFLYLTKAPIMFLYIMSCITILTLYQRWKYRRHTVKQIVIGAVIGSLFAWSLVVITKLYL